MIKPSKLADYAVVLMMQMSANSVSASQSEHELSIGISAQKLADLSHLSNSTASKVLKLLLKAGLLQSTRGINGGYSLALAPADISVADIIRAVDGPIAMTECLEPQKLNSEDGCFIEAFCPTRRAWHKINSRIEAALESVSLAEMAGAPFSVGDGNHRLDTMEARN